MSLFRATFFFKNQNGYGWTETIHSQKTTLDNVLIAAATLVPFRQALMGLDVRLAFVRVSDDLVRRDSKIFQVPLDSQGNNNATRGGSDIPNTCIVVRLDATELRRRILYLRGQPDDLVKDGGVYTVDGSWQPKFDRWLQQLIDDSWAIKGKSDLSLAIPILTLTQAIPSGVVTVVTSDPTLLRVNDNVTIRKCVGASQANGTWNILSTGPGNTFTFKVNTIVGNYLGGGQAVPSLFDLKAIVSGEIRGASHRITGVPFDRPRGRRRARAAS